jgi:hypothetical protein
VVLPTQIARSRGSDWMARKCIMLCGVKELLNQGLVLFEVEDWGRGWWCVRAVSCC